MKKVIITGVAGFIPSHLADELLKRGYGVLGFDNLLTGKLSNISNCLEHDNFIFHEADVNQLSQIEEIFVDYKPNYVFHYAACVGVKRTLDHPMWVLDDINGIKNILELSKKMNVARVFYSSSSEVYGEPVEFPQNEDTTPLNSRLPYAVVKNLGEVYLKSYQQEYGLDYTIFRFFNTYGPRQSSDFVISKFIDASLNDAPITIYGNGDQTRTFCYIEDNIIATVNSLENDGFVNKTINIGSDNELQIIELANEIVKVSYSNSPIKHLPALKEGDMTRRLPSIDNMKQLLGRDLKALKSGLSDTINYFKRSGSE